ncbi:MAG TPA: DUF4386 family protein [Epsilonproteobacteria bacterium]|nr:DUF4386 family protein [Campylobacterota bacterium]
MKSRKRAIFIGIFILLAYALLGSGNPDQKFLGMMLEIISGIAVLSIALLMYPLFVMHNKKLALWYLILKCFEAFLMVLAGILFYIHTSELLSLRENIYLIHTYIFVTGALIFYYLLYQLYLVPRWLSLWGVVASLLLVVVNLLENMGAMAQIPILYLPIVLNEVVLALWFIVKGFKNK